MRDIFKVTLSLENISKNFINKKKDIIEFLIYEI